jgi:hypothetical protein
MADNDVQGQFQALLVLLESEAWSSIWEGLKISVVTFETLALPRSASDVEVWRACQDHDVVLFTGNRNDEGPNSLETAIRTLNQDSSLPVLTLGNPKRFLHDRLYVEKVMIQLLNYLSDLDQYRGAGRLYVP